jgi:hypothetical protein
VQGHYCGKGPIAVWLGEEAPKAIARNVLWSLSLPTFASEAPLKATKRLRGTFELYKREGCCESASAKCLYSAAKHKGDHI